MVPRSLNGDGGGKGKKGSSIATLLIFVLVIWSATGFYIVSENERAVILRFGEYQRTAMPGPGWHLPRPLETHETINFTGIRSVEKRTTMLTKDENIVELASQYNTELKVQKIIYSMLKTLTYLGIEHVDLAAEVQSAVFSTLQ